MSVNDYDAELCEAIRDLAEEGFIETDTAAYGIAQQVIHMGHKSLSQKQQWVYDVIVIPALRLRAAELKRMRLQDFD